MSDVTRIILNPASSNGGGGRLAPKLERRLEARGIRYEVARSRAAGHVAELAREAALDRVARILVVGGDGTIHEVANGLLGVDAPSPPLAILPVGTGNDFFRMVGRPAGIDGALDALERGTCRSFDVGLARWDGGERYFVNLLGVGVDVEVLRHRERFQRLPGLTQYLAALLAALRRFEPVHLDVTLDAGESLREEALLCAVTVGPSVGGGFQLAPEAVADDGLLDFCLVGRLGLLRILRYIPKVIQGSHGHLDEIMLRQFRTLRLAPAGDGLLSFQLDGDLMEPRVGWIEIEARARALPILMPPADG